MDLDFQPGIDRSVSDASAPSRYVDGTWVRFVPYPEKIGGWEALLDDPVTGVPRAIFTWAAADGFERRAYGTEQKLMISALDDSSPSNITPLRLEDAALGTDPFAVVDGETAVTVTHTAHGASLYDTVYYTGATAGGGITVSGEYLITSIVSDDVYTVEHSSPATSTDATTGGAGVTASYEINVGRVSPAVGLGYGTGPYGMEAYGTPRTASGLTLPHRQWSLDNYGNELIGAYSDGGRIYTYDDGTDSEAQVLTNSPTDVHFVFVTPERFVMALCADMNLKWPDRDDFTNWTPAATNTANVRRLAIGNNLVAGAALTSVSLIWTDIGVYLLNFIGQPEVYDSPLVAVNCGLVGSDAFDIAEGIAFWMGPKGLHMFNGGTVLPIPNSNEVHDWIFDNITAPHRSKVASHYNAKKREMWFLIPMFGSSEPSHYAMVNIDNWAWSSGGMQEGRVGCWGQSPAAGIIMGAFDGYIYRHEYTLNANGAALAWSFKTGLTYVPGAEQNLDIMGFALSTKQHVGTVQVRVFAKDREDSTTEDSVTKDVNYGDGFVDTRINGRFFGHEVSQEEVDGDFSGRVSQVMVQPAGNRP